MQLKESMALTKKVSNHIPRDLSFDILSKLPLKSLKRFICVCKFWANLFEKAQFMSVYRNNFFLSRSRYDDHQNSRLLLKVTPDFVSFGYNDKMFLLSGDTFENSVKLDWPPPFEEDFEGIFIIGSVVNGILCLCQGGMRGDSSYIEYKPEQKVVLWNPSTYEFKAIPNGSFEHIILKAFPPGSVFEDLPRIPTLINIHGFGYDHVTDDYKLIRYFCFFDDIEKDDPSDESLWQIYSLKSNSWRDLEVDMPNHSWTDQWQNNGKSVYCQGMCHWWGYEDYDGKEVLVSFRLSDEDFITTPLGHNYDKFDRNLVVLKESIAMIDYDYRYSCFFISILCEFGVAESWTRLYKIGPLYGVDEPIGVGKNADIFFIKTNEEVARFDLNTELIEDIGVKGRYKCCQMVIYNESLLPIGGIHG